MVKCKKLLVFLLSACITPSAGATITVHVKGLSGEITSIKVPAKATIQQLKWRLEAKIEIAAAQQKLVFKGADLEDHQSLQQCQIQHDVTIDLIPEQGPHSPRRPELWVAVQKGTGIEKIAIDTSQAVTWKKVKRKLAKQLNVPAKQIKFKLPKGWNKYGVPLVHKKKRRLIASNITKTENGYGRFDSFVDMSSVDISACVSPYPLLAAPAFVAAMSEPAVTVQVQDVQSKGIISVQLPPKATVRQLKWRIEGQTEIAAYRQELKFKNKILKDNQKLKKCHLQHHTTIALFVQQRRLSDIRPQIWLAIQEGPEVTKRPIDTSGTITWNKVKELLVAETGIPSDQIKLKLPKKWNQYYVPLLCKEEKRLIASNISKVEDTYELLEGFVDMSSMERCKWVGGCMADKIAWPEPPMTIYVKSKSGERVGILTGLTPQITIKQVKQLLEDGTGQRVDSQRLVVHGQSPMDDETLSACDVKNQDIIHMGLSYISGPPQVRIAMQQGEAIYLTKPIATTIGATWERFKEKLLNTLRVNNMQPRFQADQIQLAASYCSPVGKISLVHDPDEPVIVSSNIIKTTLGYELAPQPLQSSFRVL